MKLNNVATAVRRPRIFLQYLNWLGKTWGQREATKKVRGEIQITGFSGFSEFLAVDDFMHDDEYQFFRNHDFGAGDIIDVGANIGVLSVFLARRFPEKRVFAVEPSPTTASALRRNVLLNQCSNIQIIQSAVSDKAGEILFHADPVSRGTASIAKYTSSVSLRVPACTLDQMVQENRIEKIALLKVDVEGFEDLVFDGGRDTLAARRARVVYFEICPPIAAAAGFDPLSPATKLREFGYRLFKLAEDGALIAADVQEIRQLENANWAAVADS